MTLERLEGYFSLLDISHGLQKYLKNPRKIQQVAEAVNLRGIYS